MAFLLLGAWSSHGDVKSASKLVETHKPSLGCSLDLVRYKFKYLHIPLSLARYWAKPSAKSFCPQWGYDKTMDTGKREDHSQESCPSCIHTSNSKTNYHHSHFKLFPKNISTWNPDNWYVSYFWCWNKRLWTILLYKNLLELIIHSIKLLEFSPWSAFTRTCEYRGL